MNLNDLKQSNMNLIKFNYKNKIKEFCKITNLDESIVFKDPKLEFRYFCYSHTEIIKKHKVPDIKQNLENEAVFVEFRILPNIEFLLLNTIFKLGSKWSYTIVCGNDNYKFINEICLNISPNIKIIKLDYNNIDIDIYNQILSSSNFWNLFTGSKILIWQEDSCVFGTNIDEFLNWDYIGAAWPRNDNQYGVGNGGFSLRSKNTMLEIIKTISIFDTQTYYKYNSKSIPEDVYFTINMIKYKIGKLAPKNFALKFSNEQYAYLNAFGGHNFFTYDTNWRDLMYNKVINDYI